MNKWTETPPTEPGWYWHRLFPENAPRAVSVFLHPKDNRPYDDCILMVSNTFRAIPVELHLGQWWSERLIVPDTDT